MGGLPSVSRCYIWQLGIRVISQEGSYVHPPGYLNMQWRINWGTTQSKPSTTPRQQRMPAVSLGRDTTSLGAQGLRGHEVLDC